MCSWLTIFATLHHYSSCKCETVTLPWFQLPGNAAVSTIKIFTTYQQLYSAGFALRISVYLSPSICDDTVANNSVIKFLM